MMSLPAMTNQSASHRGIANQIDTTTRFCNAQVIKNMSGAGPLRNRSFATHGRGRRGLPHLGEKLIWPAASSGSRPREKTFLMAEALAHRRARRDLDCPPRRTFVMIAAHCQERNPR